jgi:ribosomal protein L32
MIWILLLALLLLPWLVWAALFVVGVNRCPNCGVELPTHFAYPGTHVDVCPGCGHDRRT